MTTLIRIRSRGVLPLLISAVLSVGAVAAQAATIVIVNNDAAGVGFNDVSPRAPVGGNPGTTLGAQRLNLFQAAANIWGAILPSSVVITVRAQFAAQACTATSAVLGSAGAVTVSKDFPNAPFPNTWYHASLANRLAGVDLDVANPDINATFNLSIDAGCFGPGQVWYYGFDGLEGTNIEFLPVLLHEMGHGLNFSSVTSGSSGNQLSGAPGAWDHFLRDDATGLLWDAETPAQRVASAISISNLVWNGGNTIAAAASYLQHRPRLLVNSPAVIAGSYNIGTAGFGPAVSNPGLTGNLVLADDGVAPTSDGCTPYVNAGAIAGNIAVVDRGVCTFVVKAQQAQAAGAIGLVICNNAAGAAPGLGGADPSITIPVISVSQADGNLIKAQLAGGVNATMNLDPVLIAGADLAGRPNMFAPNPFQSGSSVSHFDVSLTPNALMEPAINNDLHNTVDLTTPVFADLGWFDQATATTLARFTAENRSDGILLAWEFGDRSDLGSVSVQRAPAAEGPFEGISTDLSFDGTLSMGLDRNVEAGKTYYYRLHVTDRAGKGSDLGLATATRAASIAGHVFLGPAMPNPTNRNASFSFRIHKPEFVRLNVVDANGRMVRTLQSGVMAPGEYVRTWDGMNDGATKAPAGVYFITLGTSEGLKSQRVAMVR